MILKSKLYYLDELDSTQEHLLGLAGEAPEGTIVVADRQTRGRASAGRSWYSPEGGLWMSALLVSPMPGLMQIAGAVAVCEAMNYFNVLLGIKWPNDLMLGGKKVGAVAAEPAGEKVILGIALNLTIKSFPEELELEATSLFLETKKRFDKTMVFNVLCKELDDLYVMCQHGQGSEVLVKWRHYTIMLGRMVRIESGTGAITGRVIDINSDGALVVVDSENKVRRLTEGRCRFL